MGKISLKSLQLISKNLLLVQIKLSNLKEKHCALNVRGTKKKKDQKVCFAILAVVKE